VTPAPIDQAVVGAHRIEEIGRRHEPVGADDLAEGRRAGATSREGRGQRVRDRAEVTIGSEVPGGTDLPSSVASAIAIWLKGRSAQESARGRTPWTASLSSLVSAVTSRLPPPEIRDGNSFLMLSADGRTLQGAQERGRARVFALLRRPTTLRWAASSMPSRLPFRNGRPLGRRCSFADHGRSVSRAARFFHPRRTIRALPEDSARDVALPCISQRSGSDGVATWARITSPYPRA